MFVRGNCCNQAITLVENYCGRGAARVQLLPSQARRVQHTMELPSCQQVLASRFSQRENPSLSATVSNTYRSHLLFHLPFNANAVTFLLATAISAIAAVP